MYRQVLKDTREYIICIGRLTNDIGNISWSDLGI